MKSKFIFGAATLICIAVASPVAADFRQVKSEAKFVEIFAGKKLVDENGGRYVIKKNGTMSGKAPNGMKIKGAWKWSGKYWCRNVVVGKRELGTNCQKWEVDGSNYRITRDKGRGKPTVGQIK